MYPIWNAIVLPTQNANHLNAKFVEKALNALLTCNATSIFTREQDLSYVTSVAKGSVNLVNYKDTKGCTLGKSPINVKFAMCASQKKTPSAGIQRENTQSKLYLGRLLQKTVIGKKTL
ncbi:unnamed protein product [Staurois parvus]|uniref:Uncharacterized protein n=1 Tax=Staurois parvus TaxID=386267 RepID=A0ABN9FCZ2_9NEOB|nr:unnamed protein product [Staurois parvus]